MEHTTTSVTVTAISSHKSEPYKNPNDVSFQVKYAEGYEGKRFWPEGKVITVSKEAAEEFTKRGIGSVVSDDAGVSAEISEESITEEEQTEISETETEETNVSKEAAEEKPAKKGKKQ